MIVVDTNIMAYLHLPGEQTALVEEVLARDAVWLVPYLWRSEFRNILALYLRRGNIVLREAYAAMTRAEETVEGREFHVQSREVLSLVMQSDCSAYDCEFVALARDFGVLLVTNDGQILRAFPDVAKTPEMFVSG